MYAIYSEILTLIHLQTTEASTVDYVAQQYRRRTVLKIMVTCGIIDIYLLSRNFQVETERFLETIVLMRVE